MEKFQRKRPAKLRRGHGLLIIYEGEGKGKTTAVMGLAVRAAGSGFNVFIVQFIKGEWPSGERNFFDTLKKVSGTFPVTKKVPDTFLGKIELRTVGKGFVKILGDRKPLSEHKVAARQGLALARQAIASGKYQLVIMDEAISAIESKLLTTRDLLQLVKEKPPSLHLALTGHYAPKALVKLADLVSRVDMVKHPYYEGVLAQRGIDY